MANGISHWVVGILATVSLSGCGSGNGAAELSPIQRTERAAGKRAEQAATRALNPTLSVAAIGSTVKMVNSITKTTTTSDGRSITTVTWTCTGDMDSEIDSCRGAGEGPGDGGTCKNIPMGATCTWQVAELRQLRLANESGQGQ